MRGRHVRLYSRERGSPAVAHPRVKELYSRRWYIGELNGFIAINFDDTREIFILYTLFFLIFNFVYNAICVCTFCYRDARGVYILIISQESRNKHVALEIIER